MYLRADLINLLGKPPADHFTLVLSLGTADDCRVQPQTIDNPTDSPRPLHDPDNNNKGLVAGEDDKVSNRPSDSNNDYIPPKDPADNDNKEPNNDEDDVDYNP